MITPTTIAHINTINDLRLSFEAALVTISSPPPVVASSRIFMDSVLKELLLDVVKRDGT